MSGRRGAEKVRATADGGFSSGLWLVALALCFVVFAQHFFGVGFTRSIDIDSDSLRVDSGHAWKLRLPQEHRTYAARFHLRVFEDGDELGPNERSNNRVREHGSGRFRLDEKGTLRISASDNASPVMSGRNYSLQVPARVKPIQMAAAVVLLLVSSVLVWRRRTVSSKGAGGNGRGIGLVAIIVLVVALTVRTWAMGAYAGFSDGGFSVNGIPYSDAMGWLDQATGLFRGTGFHGSYAGQRPFYSVFLAAAYRLFGESLHTGQVINVVCGAVSCLFLYLFIAHASGRRGIAMAAVIGFLFARQQLTDIQLLITEPMGLTLIIAGAYAWWAGLVTLNPRALFAAGALIGLSNVTRTFTMLGLPLFAFITLGACLLHRLHWKRTVLVCAMFTLGATCVMGPWMVRQKIRYNTFALSTAGSDLLYSAAMDSPGWDADLYDELSAAGVDRAQLGEAHAFFTNRYSETVKENPGRYFLRLGHWMFEYLTAHDFGQPLTRLVILLAGVVAAVRAWWKGKVLIASGCFLASAALAPLLGLIPAGMVLATSAVVAVALGDRMMRWGVMVLMATLVSGAMMSAMIGNFGMNRMMPLTSWVFIAMLFLAIEAIASRLIDGKQSEDDELREKRSRATWKGAGSVVAWVMIAVCAVAAGVVATTGFSHAGEMRTDLVLDESEETQVRDWLREQLPGARKTPDEAFFVAVVRLDHYVGFLRANEDTSHWARPFLPRDYDRTVAFVRILPGDIPLGSLMAVQFACSPRELREATQGGLVVLGGIVNFDDDAPLGHDKTMIEGLVLVPFSIEDGKRKLDLDGVKTFPVTPEAAAIMTEASAVTATEAGEQTLND